jgi:hypothetical protein
VALPVSDIDVEVQGHLMRADGLGAELLVSD